MNQSLPYVEGAPLVSANIRTTPEDFQVDEILGFEPDGQGEHQFLLVQKRNANTEWVATQLARWAKVKPIDVSYAGMKDRHALTTQWFSVRLAGKPEPDWHAFANDDLRFLAVTRHSRKLKRGALKGNRFKLVLRSIDGQFTELERRVVQVAAHGVPNYFGEQRFGNNNLAAAQALFQGEAAYLPSHKQKILVSAARSFLFNQVLGARVQSQSWNVAIEGDVFMLDGSHSIFTPSEIDDSIINRVVSHDIHPTGPLWGKGERLVYGESLKIEQQVMANYSYWCQALEAKGLKPERRSLRLIPRYMECSFFKDAAEAHISFELPAGSYATTVLREICVTLNSQRY